MSGLNSSGKSDLSPAVMRIYATYFGDELIIYVSVRFLLENQIVMEDSEFPFSIPRYHLMRYVKAEEKIVKAIKSLQNKSVDMSRIVDLKR
jgi:hypothetical protein